MFKIRIGDVVIECETAEEARELAGLSTGMEITQKATAKVVRKPKNVGISSSMTATWMIAEAYGEKHGLSKDEARSVISEARKSGDEKVLAEVETIRKRLNLG